MFDFLKKALLLIVLLFVTACGNDPYLPKEEMPQEEFIEQFCEAWISCFPEDADSCNNELVVKINSYADDWRFFTADNCLEYVETQCGTMQHSIESLQELFYENGSCFFDHNYEIPCAKPNIYLYPKETTEVSVLIDFPLGGHITTSIPEYETGWHVTVTPEGIIDDEYEFLFYESLEYNNRQQQYGWLKSDDELDEFFAENLADYGFVGREIIDFVEFWSVIYSSDDCINYALYPQRKEIMDQTVSFTITPQPDSFLRLNYMIFCNDKGLRIPQTPPAPIPFNRDGFAVTEWGVSWLASEMPDF